MGSARLILAEYGQAFYVVEGSELLLMVSLRRD